MQTMIQNIFMDQKSYELIQKNQDFERDYEEKSVN